MTANSSDILDLKRLLYRRDQE